MPREKLQKEQAAALIRPAAAQEVQKVAAPPGEAGRILGLQRSLGNQAVQRLLARAPQDEPVIEPAAPVQRQEPTEEEEG